MRCTGLRTLAGESCSDDRTDEKGTEKCVSLHFESKNVEPFVMNMQPAPPTFRPVVYKKEEGLVTLLYIVTCAQPHVHVR